MTASHQSMPISARNPAAPRVSRDVQALGAKPREPAPPVEQAYWL
jgi:hypothetical protein